MMRSLPYARACLAKHLLHLPRHRQDACQDMLQCFGLELYSELGVFLEAQRFGGGSKSVYVLFYYPPPCVLLSFSPSLA
jgi:hypothetical protein